MADEASEVNEAAIEEHEDLFDDQPVEANEEPVKPAGEALSEEGEPADPKAEPEQPADPVAPKDGEQPQDPNAPAEPEAPAAVESEEAKKAKARADWTNRQRKNLDDRISTVEQEEQKKQQELDPEDPDYRVKKLESDNEVRKARDEAREVEANLNQLNIDGDAVAQNIPMFRPVNVDGTPNSEFNRAAFKAAEAEFARTYLVTSNEEKPEDRIILGAFDPKTGKPVSYYQYMQGKAKEYAAVVAPTVQKTAEETRIAERRMRGAGDPVGGGSSPRVESAQDKEAREMAEAFK